MKKGAQYGSRGVLALGRLFGFFGRRVDAIEEQVSQGRSLKSFKSGEAYAHFEKHRGELSDKFNIRAYTQEQYVNDANHVIDNGIFVPELNAYVMIPSGKGSALAPFVGVDRTTGEITTFHLKSVSFLEKKAPSLGWFAKKNIEYTTNRELEYKSGAVPFNRTLFDRWC